MRHFLAFAGLALATPLLAQTKLVLPDNHHLMESPTQLANSGVTSYWSTTGGRFQILYEASHFTNMGVNGPALISKIAFRGEDGEPNLGGQVYSNVQVAIGSTSLTAATLTNTFATNLAAATTTMSLGLTTNVTVLGSVGSTPNNYCIEIDVLSLGFTHDPTSARPNFLIDITMPTAPTNPLPLSLIPMQDTTASGAGIRGRGLTTTVPGSATGTLSATPLVVGVEILGPGGHANPIPARNERYGAGCGGSASTFYEHFQNGQAWDLTGLTMVPDNPTAPNFYVVTNGAGPFDPTRVNATPNSTGDDALVTHALGFTFRYPGGSTTTIKPCTNGFVWLDSAMTATSYIPTAADILGTTTNYTARFMPYWNDLHAGRNTATHPNSGLHVQTDTSGGPGNAVCYVTWLDVGLFRTVSGTGIGGHAVLNFQCVLYEATGMVEFRYLSMPPFVSHWTTTTNALHTVVGFTRGRISGVGSVDPQSRDLSHETPFATSVEGAAGNMGQTVTTTPVVGGAIYGGRLMPGQTAIYGAVNVPAGSILAVQAIDTSANRPGLQIPTITAPGCMLSVTFGAAVWEVFVLPSGTVTGTVPLTVPGALPSGLLGINIYSQFLVLGGLFGGPDLISVASNAMKQTIGLN
jgi:hypothetical protein